MSDVSPAKPFLADRIQARLDALGLSAFAASEKAGLGESYVRDILRRRVRNPRDDTLNALAKVLETTPAYLMGREDDPAAPSSDTTPPRSGRKTYPLSVHHDVAAGIWLEVDQLTQIEPEESPLRSSPNWPPYEQWVSRVRGDSMNRIYPDGCWVSCVSIFALGSYKPRTGQHVEVLRRRDGGALIEITLKEVVVASDGTIELWPRSTNPKWSEPLRITDGIDPADEAAEVQIRGLVTGKYQELTIII